MSISDTAFSRHLINKVIFVFDIKLYGIINLKLFHPEIKYYGN